MEDYLGWVGGLSDPVCKQVSMCVRTWTSAGHESTDQTEECIQDQSEEGIKRPKHHQRVEKQFKPQTHGWNPFYYRLQLFHTSLFICSPFLPFLVCWDPWVSAQVIQHRLALVLKDIFNLSMAQAVVPKTAYLNNWHLHPFSQVSGETVHNPAENTDWLLPHSPFSLLTSQIDQRRI